MNILITGAGGFIGIHLSDLLGKNHKVYKIYSSSNPASDNNAYAVDLTDRQAVENLINVLSPKKFDVIIHLASKMASPDKIEDLVIFKENFAITENIVYLTKKVKPEMLINFSSMAVYPNVSGLFSENSLPDPQKNPDCIYGLSKYSSEVIIDFLFRDENIRVVHFRVAQVFGEGMREDRIIPVMRRELEESNTITVYGNGKRESCFIEIGKLVDTVAHFLKHEVSGIYNVGDQNLSYYDLAKKVLEQYGNKNSTIVKVPQGSREKFNLDTFKLRGILNK
jgi:nucleoside-diphosphate-sugar epimerase